MMTTKMIHPGAIIITCIIVLNLQQIPDVSGQLLAGFHNPRPEIRPSLIMTSVHQNQFSDQHHGSSIASIASRPLVPLPVPVHWNVPLSPVMHHLIHNNPAGPTDWMSFHHNVQPAPPLIESHHPNSVYSMDELAVGNRPRTMNPNSKPASRRRQAFGGAKPSKTNVKHHQPQSPFAFDSQSTPVQHINNRNNTVMQRARPSNSKQKKLVCYYGSWAVYRPDAGKYPVENIDPHLCTHIIYGFTGLSYDNTIKTLDPWNDLEDNYGKGAMKRFTNLKRLNPDLKTLIAIGGWNEGSIKYSRMAAVPEARAKFVDSCVKFIQKYNFDGLDLDWEYPGSRGGSPSDKQNFVNLLRELHHAFQPHGYLLTAAVSAGLAFAQPAYDIPQVSKYLDLINLMAYDYHGGWDTKTGMNAPLFHSPKHDLSREDRTLNVNWSVNYWLVNGAPAEKIMLGVGSYGRSWTLDKESENGINAPASQKGRAGPYTREPGSLGYNEICESIQQNPRQWTIVRDPDYMSPYAYSGRLWVGYDDRESLALKAQYAKSMGLGGMMMWSIETDDFHGRCHDEKYPLLNTIKRVMNGQSTNIQPTRPPKPSPSTTSSTTLRPPIINISTSTTPKPDHEVEGEASSPRPVIPATSSTTTKRPPIRPTSTKKPTVPSKPSKRPPPKPTTISTTSTTTTTTGAPSTTPTSIIVKPPREFACQADGMFADPTNCRKFIRCVSQFGSYAMYRFDCAPGTAFNEQQQYCDHLYNVPNCR